MTATHFKQQESILRRWQPQALKNEATTFPAEMYTSQEVYQLEKTRVFGKSWYYVGHISQLHGPGSYFTVEIAEQPLVIVQTKTGEMRAFFNVCTHRAGPVALGSGKCQRLTCLYHAWSFNLEGKLRGIPRHGNCRWLRCRRSCLNCHQRRYLGTVYFCQPRPPTPSR